MLEKKNKRLLLYSKFFIKSNYKNKNNDETSTNQTIMFQKTSN